MNKILKATVLLVAALTTLTACTSGENAAAKKATAGNASLQAQVYNPTNNVEFNNYNERQKIADDPATILWCTAYLDNPNVPPITYPIVGKLTSSNKRPYATTVNAASGDTDEVPGPDKMYGTSTEYRYGFTPGGVYVDFTGINTICTTEPTVYQATKTTIVLQTDTALNAAATQAHAALTAGKQANGTISQQATDQANSILQKQINALASQAPASTPAGGSK